MAHRFNEAYPALTKLPLDPYHYTISLLQRVEELAWLDQQHLEHIHQQFLSLLKDTVIRYSQGDSSSIKVETGERLMLSILYCVDAYISNLNNPREAIEILSTVGVKEVHRRGLELVNQCWQETKTLYQEILKLDIDNEAYQSTVDEALPACIEHYDPEFASNDTMGSIDYPLLLDDMKVQGIFYIRNYLYTLVLENKFCHRFSLNDIKELLSDYGQLYQIDYKEALINIFEIVLCNSIFSLLSGNRPTEIRMTAIQYRFLRDKLMGLDEPKCRSQIKEAIESLIAELDIEDQNEKNYIREYFGVLMPRLLSALNNDSLHNVVILEREATNTQAIIYDAGKTMNNESFCTLLEEISVASDPSLRAQVIIRGIHSLGDFIDVLESDCLYDQDYWILFSQLGDFELALLAKLIFIEEMRAEADAFDLYSAAEDKDAYWDWQKQYCRFAQSLNEDQLNRIEGLITASLAIRK
ncbi:MAG: hypothetical protein GX119_00425 [Syntrophomonadaceae bacterium]|jgi:hypothetical protein|nr:hypothetical protein [Syntrophomonadaceae bacterium]